MPSVKIGTTDKRVNSTKQSFTGTSLSCKLKEPCSMQQPVFQVQGLTKGTLYNYCQFESRYYWVDDVVYLTNNIQEVHCHLDPMATFKSAIGATTGFALYADKNHWAKKIDDPRMEADIQPYYQTPALTIADAFDSNIKFSATWSSMTVIMRVCSTPDSSSGFTPGVHTYAMTYPQFINTLTDLSAVFLNLVPNLVGLNFDAIIEEVAEFWAKLYAALAGSGSWVDNILSCVLVPLDISTYSGYASTSTMYIGNIATTPGGTLYNINDWEYNWHADTIAIPWRQQAIDHPYLRRPRFNALQAQILGQYANIDTTDLVDQDELGMYSCVQPCTGDWSLKVTEQRGDTKEILATFGGNFAVDLMGLVSAHMTKDDIRNAAVGNLIGGGISKVTPIVGDAVGGVIKSAASTGLVPNAPSGAVAAGGTEIFLIEPGTTTSLGKFILTDVQYMPRTELTYEDFCDMYGYPCSQYIKPSDMTGGGYIQFSGASVGNGSGGVGGSEENKKLINQYMNTGFYYE